jgi:hypothetical protein
MERSGSVPAVDPSSRSSTLAGIALMLGVDTISCDDFKRPAGPFQCFSAVLHRF